MRARDSRAGRRPFASPARAAAQNFLNMLSMVGGLSLITTTLMVPPLLYISFHKDEISTASTAMYLLLSKIGMAAAAGAVYSGLVAKSSDT